MADLSVDFAGIKSPNPFWLASAPPTNMGSMVERAFVIVAGQHIPVADQPGHPATR